MAKINLNDLAKRIAKKESGKKQVSIAQIKEIIKLVGDELTTDFENFSGHGAGRMYPDLYVKLVKQGQKRRRVKVEMK